VSLLRQGQDWFAILNWRQVAAEMNVMFLPTIWHSLSRLFASGLLAHATVTFLAPRSSWEEVGCVIRRIRVSRQSVQFCDVCGNAMEGYDSSVMEIIH
jgi:hypothetical protein